LLEYQVVLLNATTCTLYGLSILFLADVVIYDIMYRVFWLMSRGTFNNSM